MQDAKLQLSAPSTHDTVHASADSEGRFTIGPLRHWRLILPLYGDRVYSFELSIKSADGDELFGNKFSTFGPEIGLGGSDLQLACDLSHPVERRQERTYCVPLSKDAHP